MDSSSSSSSSSSMKGLGRKPSPEMALGDDPRVYFGKGDRKTIGKKRARSKAGSRCQAEGCGADLSTGKWYHMRHRVCELHAKSPVSVVGGIQQRFCQQCSRFHVLGEFDEGKRSCRRRLAGHNQRRRKPIPNLPSWVPRPSQYSGATAFYGGHFAAGCTAERTLPCMNFRRPMEVDLGEALHGQMPASYTSTGYNQDVAQHPHISGLVHNKAMLGHFVDSGMQGLLLKNGHGGGPYMEDFTPSSVRALCLLSNDWSTVDANADGSSAANQMHLVKVVPDNPEYGFASGYALQGHLHPAGFQTGPFVHRPAVPATSSKCITD